MFEVLLTLGALLLLAVICVGLTWAVITYGWLPTRWGGPLPHVAGSPPGPLPVHVAQGYGVRAWKRRCHVALCTPVPPSALVLGSALETELPGAPASTRAAFASLPQACERGSLTGYRTGPAAGPGAAKTRSSTSALLPSIVPANSFWAAARPWASVPSYPRRIPRQKNDLGHELRIS